MYSPVAPDGNVAIAGCTKRNGENTQKKEKSGRGQSIKIQSQIWPVFGMEGLVLQ